MRLVTTLAATALVLLAAITLTGCASATDLVKALATDNASACVAVTTPVYGSAAACRTNTPGMAVIEASGGSVKIQHQGTAR